MNKRLKRISNYKNYNEWVGASLKEDKELYKLFVASLYSDYLSDMDIHAFLLGMKQASLARVSDCP